MESSLWPVASKNLELTSSLRLSTALMAPTPQTVVRSELKVPTALRTGPVCSSPVHSAVHTEDLVWTSDFTSSRQWTDHPTIPLVTPRFTPTTPHEISVVQKDIYLRIMVPPPPAASLKKQKKKLKFIFTQVIEQLPIGIKSIVSSLGQDGVNLIQPLSLVPMTPAFSVNQQPHEAVELALKGKPRAFLCVLLLLLHAPAQTLNQSPPTSGL